MAQKQPAAGEYPLQLLLVDLRFNKDPVANKSPFGIDKTSDIDSHKTLREVPRPEYVDDASYDMISAAGIALHS